MRISVALVLSIPLALTLRADAVIPAFSRPMISTRQNGKYSFPDRETYRLYRASQFAQVTGLPFAPSSRNADSNSPAISPAKEGTAFGPCTSPKISCQSSLLNKLKGGFSVLRIHGPKRRPLSELAAIPPADSNPGGTATVQLDRITRHEARATGTRRGVIRLSSECSVR